MDDEEGEGENPSTIGSAANGPPPHREGDGAELRVSPNKNRLVQVRRAGGRKLFDGERKAVFLEWFAATCNAKLSAERAGVCYQTVFKHRMKDPGFAATWDEAIEQGYARIEARLVQEACPLSPTPLPRGGEGLDEKFDPELAMQLLREHKRRLPGSAEKRKNLRTTARVASDAEVIAALEKRLKGFALRVAKDSKKS